MVRITEIRYLEDSGARFVQLRELPWPVFLDGGGTRHRQSRYDILAADPYVRVSTRGAQTEIISRAGAEISSDDPLSILDGLLECQPSCAAPLPFCGGAIGYLGYDLGRRYELIPSIARADIDVPDLVIGLYDWAIVVDHQLRKSWLVAQGRDTRTAGQWTDLQRRFAGPGRPSRGHFEVTSEVQSNLPRRAYDRAFEQIKDHIRRGDAYQVNLTQRFQAAVRGDAWQAYEQLRVMNPAPYSAYLEYPFGQVLSSSPERFLKLSGKLLETSPIKGTRPRDKDSSLDARLAAQLRASPKDRAENVMIVDLLRNDFGKNCVPGSIAATELFKIESFSSVHHLVSTVQGSLAPDRTALDALRGCFPGGSITGAPKVRAMQIIDELEPHRRSVYCGAIGYIGFDGRMDTSIAIRTLVRCKDFIYAWAGGGVVADSKADSEYQESLDKASTLLDVLASSRVSVAS